VGRIGGLGAGGDNTRGKRVHPFECSPGDNTGTVVTTAGGDEEQKRGHQKLRPIETTGAEIRKVHGKQIKRI